MTHQDHHKTDSAIDHWRGSGDINLEHGARPCRQLSGPVLDLVERADGGRGGDRPERVQDAPPIPLQRLVGRDRRSPAHRPSGVPA